MAKKPTITTLTSGFNSTTTLNNNFTALRNAFDNTLSLDGSTPNAMNADLDMNSKDIINADTIETSNLKIKNVSVVPSNVQFLQSTDTKDSVSDLIADTAFAYVAGAPNAIVVAAGDIIRTVTEGLAYEVAASNATDAHITTAGGVKLYEAGPGFSTRERFVSAVARGMVPVDGQTYFAEGQAYVGSTGSTEIDDLPGLVSGTTKKPRESLAFFVHSDGQPRINDTAMPAGQENVQWGIYMNVLNDTGRAFGGKVAGMLHCGDVAWRGAMSASAIASAITALGDMDPNDPGADLLIGVDNAIPGDEYPWGIGAILNEYEARAKISRTRVFAASGNHDTSGAGNGTNPIAYSFETFEKYFGKTAYHIIEGNVGFYILGTENGYGSGGQISRENIDQARRVIQSYDQVKHWAFLIHQPPAGRSPREAVDPTAKYYNAVTLSSGQVATWSGGGAPLVTVGAYAGLRTNRTNLFLVHPYLGRILLVPGVDYNYSTTVNASPPAGYEVTASLPYNQIELLQTWTHGTLTTSTQLQLHTVLSLGPVQDGPTTFMLEDLFAEVQPFAVFHGHIGGTDDAADPETNGGIRQVAAWGNSYLVNMNMSLPSRARLGIDPINEPLVSGLLEFDAEADTIRFRYWNHTATINGTTGVYTGDWMSETHPLLTTEFTIDVSDYGGLDLGVEGSTIDGRREVVREAQLNFLDISRDIKDTASRREPVRDVNGQLVTTVVSGITSPTYADAAGRVHMGRFAITDKTLKDLQPGDGGYISYEVPQALDSDAGGESAWRDNQPSREMLRHYFETTSGSDSTAVGALGWEVLDAAGNWQDVLRLTSAGLFTFGNPVIESGTNANGTYVKYADGTLIMTGEVNITNLQTGTGSEVTTVTLPHTRSVLGYTPTAQITINATASKWSALADRGKYVFSSRSDSTTTLTILYYAIAGTTPTGGNGAVGYTMTTRWD